MIRLQRSLLSSLQTATPTLQDVCTALQQAVELEHATIPVYLYALYSLVPSTNTEIAGIIESVVVEEMLHMTLASNVLNALGGSPQIGQPGFVPSYPGPLPGGVETGLIVNLAPFSMTQLQAFLDIEEPEDPINYKASAALEETGITIGEFYTAISDAIALLGNGVFVNPPRNQVGPDLMPESVVVTDVSTAQQAINTIIEQGEGTSSSPEEVVGGGYAHYYRFMQIQKGYLLVKDPQIKPPNPQYSYTGAPVPFDPLGVYAVPTDPKAATYPPGSTQRFACDNFNYTYTSLLLALNALFNGQSTPAQFNTSIGLMMSLKGQAKAMMAGIPDPTILTGPSFEYQPVNPLAAPTAIQTTNGQFLSAVNGGGIGDPPGAPFNSMPIHTNATAIGPWETFNVVPVGTGNFAIMTPSGNYLTAVNGGGMGTAGDGFAIHTDREKPGSDESFTLISCGNGQYAFMTSSGNYVTAVNGGGIGDPPGYSYNRLPIHTDATAIGPWETFTFVFVPPSQN